MAKQKHTPKRVSRGSAKTHLKSSTPPKEGSAGATPPSRAGGGNTTPNEAEVREGLTRRDSESGRPSGSAAGNASTTGSNVTREAPKTRLKTAILKPARKASEKAVATRDREPVSASAKTVTTGRATKGKPKRVVLTPYRGGSLRRDLVESVVSKVLARHEKK